MKTYLYEICIIVFIHVATIELHIHRYLNAHTYIHIYIYMLAPTHDLPFGGFWRERSCCLSLLASLSLFLSLSLSVSLSLCNYPPPPFHWGGEDREGGRRGGNRWEGEGFTKPCQACVFSGVSGLGSHETLPAFRSI